MVSRPNHAFWASALVPITRQQTIPAGRISSGEFAWRMPPDYVGVTDTSAGSRSHDEIAAAKQQWSRRLVGFDELAVNTIVT